jgi:hypothetical protein
MEIASKPTCIERAKASPRHSCATNQARAETVIVHRLQRRLLRGHGEQLYRNNQQYHEGQFFIRRTLQIMFQPVQIHIFGAAPRVRALSKVTHLENLMSFLLRCVFCMIGTL